MENFDFDKITKSPEIIEVNRIVETFNIIYHRAPKDMKIDIVQNINNYYMGICNYRIWGPNQALPYKSVHLKKTINEALNDALCGIQQYDSAAIPDNYLFWVSDDDIIVNGVGEIVTQKEADKLRKTVINQKYEKKSWTQALVNGGPWWLITKNFNTKQFSIAGPFDDDKVYIEKVSKAQQKEIDFFIETVPIERTSKEELIDYYKNQMNLEMVDHDYI